MNDHAVLIDTHVWLWLEQGSDRLQETKALAAIQKAKRSGGILVSVISIWEVAMLAAKHRIRLSQDCRLWVERALATPGIRLQPLTPDIAVASSFLPGDFHADPSDRLLVATARELNIPIITADANIIAYSNSKYVKAIEA